MHYQAGKRLNSEYAGTGKRPDLGSGTADAGDV
jgi:hypothetical protein